MTELKAELIQRLTEAEPDILDRPQEQQRIQDNLHYETENDKLGTSSSGLNLNNESNVLSTEASLMQREMHLLRRERDLLEREVQLLRSSAVQNNTNSHTERPIGIDFETIGELLNDFPLKKQSIMS